MCARIELANPIIAFCRPWFTTLPKGGFVKISKTKKNAFSSRGRCRSTSFKRSSTWPAAPKNADMENEPKGRDTQKPEAQTDACARRSGGRPEGETCRHQFILLILRIKTVSSELKQYPLRTLTPSPYPGPPAGTFGRVPVQLPLICRHYWKSVPGFAHSPPLSSPRTRASRFVAIVNEKCQSCMGKQSGGFGKCNTLPLLRHDPSPDPRVRAPQPRSVRVKRRGVFCGRRGSAAVTAHLRR